MGYLRRYLNSTIRVILLPPEIRVTLSQKNNCEKSIEMNETERKSSKKSNKSEKMEYDVRVRDSQQLNPLEIEIIVFLFVFTKEPNKNTDV